MLRLGDPFCFYESRAQIPKLSFPFGVLEYETLQVSLQAIVPRRLRSGHPIFSCKLLLSCYFFVISLVVVSLGFCSPYTQGQRGRDIVGVTRLGGSVDVTYFGYN